MSSVEMDAVYLRLQQAERQIEELTNEIVKLERLIQQRHSHALTEVERAEHRVEQYALNVATQQADRVERALR